MDNVCHTLVGAALGEAGLKRGSRWGAAALMISANIPDLDVLVFATDTPSVSFRRGWTHGILAQLALPVLLTAAFWLLNQRRPPRRGLRSQRASASAAVARSCTGSSGTRSSGPCP